MKSHREPIRMCVGCRKRDSKYYFLRFVAKDGRLYFDPDYKAPGRGVSVCPDVSCITKAFKKGLFSRALKTQIKEPSTLDELLNEIRSVLVKRIVSTLRIGYRYRGVIVGREQVEMADRKKRLKLLILAEDLSERSKGEFSKIGCDRFVLFTQNFWGEVFSRRPVGVIGIVDTGLAEKVRRLILKYVLLFGRDANGRKLQN